MKNWAVTYVNRETGKVGVISVWSLTKDAAIASFRARYLYGIYSIIGVEEIPKEPEDQVIDPEKLAKVRADQLRVDTMLDEIFRKEKEKPCTGESEGVELNKRERTIYKIIMLVLDELKER